MSGLERSRKHQISRKEEGGRGYDVGKFRIQIQHCKIFPSITSAYASQILECGSNYTCTMVVEKKKITKTKTKPD